MLSYYQFVAINILAVFFLFRMSVDRKLAFALLILKLLSASLFFWIYTSFYNEGDLLFYERVLNEVFNVYQEHGFLAYLKYLFLSEWPVNPQPDWFTRARIPVFIKFVSVAHLMAWGNFAVTGFYLAVFNVYVMLGIALRLHRKLLFFPVLATFVLVPSFMLFTSGINKESVVIPLLALCFFFQYTIRKPGFRLAPLLVFALLIYGIRPFLGVIYAAQFLIHILFLYRVHRTAWWNTYKWFIYSGIAVLAIGVFYLLSLKNLPEVLILQYEKYYKISSGSHMIHLDFDGYGWWALLKQVPVAFYRSWIGPQWQDLNLMVMASKIECLALLFLFVLALVLDLVTKRYYILKRPELLFYVLFFACFLPIAAPDWGTFMRYRLMYMPIVGIYIFWMLRKVLWFDRQKRKREKQ